MSRDRHKEISPSMDVGSGDEQLWTAVKTKTSKRLTVNDLPPDGMSGTASRLLVTQKLQCNTQKLQCNVLLQQQSREADVDMRQDGNPNEERGSGGDFGLQFTKKPMKVNLKGLVQEKSCETDVDMRDEDVDCSKKKKVLPPEQSPQQQNVQQLAPVVNKRKSCQMQTAVEEGTSYGAFTNYKETKEIIDRHNCNGILCLKKGSMKQSSKGVVYDKMFSGFNWNNMPQFKKTSDGTFGSVATFKDEKTKKDLVIKKFKDNTEISINEIGVPLTFKSNPFIGNVMGLGYNESTSYLVMEDSGINLSTVIKQHCVPDPRRWQLFQQKIGKLILLDMLRAFSALGPAGVVHRDVKPENICLKFCPKECRHVAKLIDFGSCLTLQDQAMRPVGITCEYLPPSYNAMYCRCLETNGKIQPRQLTHKDDMYGLAMTIVFTAQGSHPMIKHFTHQNNQPDNYPEIRLKVLKEIGKMTSLPENFFSYPECRELEPVLRKMLTLNDGERPGALEALNMLEGPKRVQLPPAKKMKVEPPEIPPGNDNHDLPQNLSALTIAKPRQKIKVVYRQPVEVKQEQPKIVPKFCTQNQLTLKHHQFQTQECSHSDESVLKIHQGPTHFRDAQSVAVFGRRSLQSKRQQKVETEFNGPEVENADYQDLMAFFAGTSKGNMQNPTVQPKMQQAKPTVSRETHLINLGQHSKPVTYQQCPVEFQRQPSTFQFDQKQALPQQGPQVFRFQGVMNANQCSQEEKCNTQAFQLRIRGQEFTKPANGAPGFIRQGQPGPSVKQQDTTVYDFQFNPPQRVPETSPKEVVGNMPDFGQLF